MFLESGVSFLQKTNMLPHFYGVSKEITTSYHLFKKIYIYFF